jgi:hypothetical protein
MALNGVSITVGICDIYVVGGHTIIVAVPSLLVPTFKRWSSFISGEKKQRK